MLVSLEVEKEGFKRTLSLFTAVAFGIGGMIGAGVFALTGELVIGGGIYAIPILLFTASIAICNGIIYGIFSKKVDAPGGGYSFVNATIKNDLIDFLSGWLFFLAYSLAGAFYVGVFGRYIEILTGFPFILFSVLLILFFNLVNFVGINESGLIESIFTVLKVSIIIFFIVIGLSNTVFSKTIGGISHTPAPSLLTFLSLSATIFIAFEGFDIISNLSKEIKDYRKNVVRAIILSITTVTTLYILVAYIEFQAYKIGLVPKDVSPEEVILYAASGSLLNIGYYLVVFGAIISTISAYNATLVAVSRLIYAMSSDGHLPRFLNNIHKKSGTPRAAIFTSSAIILAVIIFEYFITDVERISIVLGQLASLAFAISFSIVNLAFIVLAKKGGGSKKKFLALGVYSALNTIVLASILAIMNIIPSAIIFALIILGLFIKKNVK